MFSSVFSKHRFINNFIFILIILSMTSSLVLYCLPIGGVCPAAASEVFIVKWGSSGSGDGQFSYPGGIAADSSGNVFVVDTFNRRIQKFDSNGNFIAKWGSIGPGDGQFYNPEGIAADALGNIFVADTRNHRIQKFDSNGNFITKWGSSGSGDGQFSYPGGIAADSSGNVYVADTNNCRIQKFDSNGIFIAKWGSIGSGDREFNYPRDIAVNISGNIYVADSDNNRIQKFDLNGNFITKWGSLGSGDGQFSSPVGIAVDSSGNIYVADSDNNRIQKFDSNGNFITKWGSLGSGDGQFSSPGGVAVDALGNFFVADTRNNRIQKFGPDNTPPMTSLSTNPSSPNGTNGWYSTDPTIYLSSNESGGTINFRWDSGVTQIYSAPITAPEGIHTLYYWSVDSSNNVEAQKSATFKVDTVAPSLLISSPKAKRYVKGAVPIKVAAATETKKVDFYVDGKLKATDLASPFSYTWQTVKEKVKNGSHTIKAIAQDEATNSTPKTITLYVDNFKPYAKITAQTITVRKGGLIKFKLFEYTKMSVKVLLRIKAGKKTLRSIPKSCYASKPGTPNWIKWDGKDSKKKFVKPGKYLIELNLTDLARNMKIVTAKLNCR